MYVRSFRSNDGFYPRSNTLGPLRHVVVGPSGQSERGYLVIFPAEVGGKPKPVQIQLE
jgi:hypothetical protein